MTNENKVEYTILQTTLTRFKIGEINLNLADKHHQDGNVVEVAKIFVFYFCSEIDKVVKRRNCKIVKNKRVKIP